MKIDFTHPPTRMTVNLILSQHTLEEIHQVLAASPASRHCTKVHISHPVIPITMKHLRKLQGLVHSGKYQNISTRTCFHHLRITTISPLIPRDRSLHITNNNIIYVLTPTGTTNVATPHHLHLFLNPHNCMPYLRHAYSNLISESASKAPPTIVFLRTETSSRKK